MDIKQYTAKPQPAAPPAVKPPRRLFTAAHVLTLFTLQFLAFLWLDYCGIKSYPAIYTPVYLAVLAGVSLSNLLRRSRWFM